MNRVIWDMTYPGPVTFPGMVFWGATTSGPSALPGKYQVRLTADGHTSTEPLVISKHPLYPEVTDADLKEQFDLAMRIRDKVSEANRAVIQIRDIKQQVADRLTKSPDAALKRTAQSLVDDLSTVEQAIYQVRNQSNQDPLNFPIKINNRLASLLRVVNTGDGKPIASVYPIFNDLIGELKVQTDKLTAVLAADLEPVNNDLRRLAMPTIDPNTRPTEGTW